MEIYYNDNFFSLDIVWGVVEMKLTPRLLAVADKVPPGSRVADIGTDHAYIPVYLLMNHISSGVIATDSRPGPLQAAAETLELFRLQQLAELRLGEGLTVLRKEDDIDVIIIAGLGGDTICSILADGLEFLQKGILLILQPMTCVGKVRTWLAEKGFAITEEDIALEESNFYEVVVARWTGETALAQEKYLSLGPVLVARKHPLLKPMLEQRLEHKEAALAGAEYSNSPAAQERIAKLKAEILAMREVLQCL